MTRETQPTEPVTPPDLAARAAAFHADGWRLMQICCTVAGTDFELLYSFARESALQNLRVTLPREGASLPSITPIYLCAFLYENEIHDLFGVSFPGLLIDFQGHFLRTRQKTPFAPAPPPCLAGTDEPPPTPAAT